MPQNWKTYKLFEILDIKNGKTKPKKQGAYPIYGGNGILGYGDKSNQSGEVVLIGRVGAYCGAVYYENRDLWVSDNSLFGIANSGFDTKFTYYLLKWADLNRYATGSSQPLLTQGGLNVLEFEVPEYDEQISIARILSALDDKIELNLAMNRTLEDMARTLYKHWFVDFGPFQKGEFIDSELGMIPKGWEVKRLDEVWKSSQYGYTESSSTEIVGPKFLRITDIQGGTVEWEKVPYCPISEKDLKKYQIQKGDLLVARTGNSTGENTYILNPPNSVFASYLIRFQFDELFLACYVAKSFRSKRFFDFIDGSKAGSAQPGISASALGSFLVLIPPTSELKKYFKSINPLDENKEQNLFENQTLTTLRDTLLPKLISGEVRVKDADQILEQAI